MKKHLLVVCLSFVFLLGCASMVDVTRYTDEVFVPTTGVEVLKARPSDRAYVEVGEISVASGVPDQMNYFVDQAKALGADAIVVTIEKDSRTIPLYVGDKVLRKRRSEIWALAIKYKEGPHVAQAAARGMRPYYAVVALEKLFATERWSAQTNFTLVTQTPSHDVCLAELKKESFQDQISGACVEGGESYEKVFRREPTGHWYVTVDLENSYPGVAILTFGRKLAPDGSTLEWRYVDALEVARAVASGMNREADASGMVARIRIFSPKEEVGL